MTENIADTGVSTGGASTENAPSGDTFVVDGKQLTVDDIRELQKGGLRQQDYTRKTQELAAERKRLEQLAAFERFLAQNPHIYAAVDEAVKRAASEGPVVGTPPPVSVTSPVEAIAKDMEEFKFLRAHPDVTEDQLREIRETAEKEKCSLGLAHKAWIADKKLPEAFKEGAATASKKPGAVVDPSRAPAPVSGPQKTILDVPAKDRGRWAEQFIKQRIFGEQTK